MSENSELLALRSRVVLLEQQLASYDKWDSFENAVFQDLRKENLELKRKLEDILEGSTKGWTSFRSIEEQWERDIDIFIELLDDFYETCSLVEKCEGNKIIFESSGKEYDFRERIHFARLFFNAKKTVLPKKDYPEEPPGLEPPYPWFEKARARCAGTLK